MVTLLVKHGTGHSFRGGDSSIMTVVIETYRRHSGHRYSIGIGLIFGEFCMIGRGSVGFNQE
jgi:hypothetical protein